jgi:hypothetical protein
MIPTDNEALTDGRHICRECKQTTVTDPAEILRMFQVTRAQTAQWFGFDNTHHINLKIVDLDELIRLSPNVYTPENGRKMSLMNYQQQITEQRAGNKVIKRFVSAENCTIYVLDNIPRTMLIDAIIHELAHDHLRHNKGEVNDLTTEEGFCELAAALGNEKTGNEFLNRQKELNPDPVYGGGYRKMRALYLQHHSLQQVLRYVK